ncbi:MAG: 50S ribosomal protein L18 [Pirellulales bacterium]
MSRIKTINVRRKRRGFRIGNRIKRDSTRPRLTVFRSNSNMYAQIVDDEAGKTLVSASTLEKANRGAYGGNKDAAKAVGKLIAERALAAGIKEVAFDRGDSKYHGRIAALAEGAREAGLQF